MGARTKIKKYIQVWESRCYPTGIPDEAPTDLESAELVPSYRRICKALLKNDYTLKSLGFQPKKSPVYMELKRIELIAKGKI